LPRKLAFVGVCELTSGRSADADGLTSQSGAASRCSESQLGSALAKPARPTVPSPGRAATLLAANAARVARKEAGLIAAAVKAARPLAEAFADHAGFVATVMAVNAEAAAAYTAATIARAESLLAADPAFTTQQWVDTQTAALLQLES